MASNQNHEENLYDVLGCDRSATREQLKRCYQKLALQYHPDKRKDGSSSQNVAADRFGLIDSAWKTLGDPFTRQEYDAQLLDTEMVENGANVSDTVELRDMSKVRGEDKYRYPCRCGGCYVLTLGAEEAPEPVLLVECDTCSLCIAVRLKPPQTTG